MQLKLSGKNKHSFEIFRRPTDQEVKMAQSEGEELLGVLGGIGIIENPPKLDPPKL